MGQRGKQALDIEQPGIGRADVGGPVGPEFGALRDHAVKTTHGLQCSHCGGRVLTELHERIAA